MTWEPPDLSGRTYAVTGGNAGIGRFIVRRLADAGADVLVLSRDAGEAAIWLDLADLDSVAAAATELSALPRLDGLILNAGTNAGKQRLTTEQGFELAMGTNHLGHFALTALAMPALTATPGSRVVSIGSIMTKAFAFDPDEQRYSRQKAYARSKHAVLLFAFELDRRLRAVGAGVRSLAAHPGLAVEGMPLPWPIQDKDRGARPAVRAASDPHALGGFYYGPKFGTAGVPVPVRPPQVSKDPVQAERIWTWSEEQTGITFDLPAGTP
ncbi:SDR family NAD(P)-dependent oxidoreductase [Lentzea sp. JNUCC 0626]|uniref:SDR family NAD(P)-dependent oxidoreductase n=1 Tax=Lentzea sp. JNUCC 0626 TaxID=3367513 RepID=UPI0037482E6A